MANAWTLQEGLSFHNSKAIAGDYHADDDNNDNDNNNNNNSDDQALKTWMMMQDELVQDGYLNCMFEHQPPHPLSSHKGALSLPAMASTPPVLPSPPPPPPLNFGQFSRPVADAKALLQMAAFGRRMKLNDLHLNPNGVVPEVSVSALSSTDSNVGLAHQHLQISPPIRKELPCLPHGLGGAAAAHNSLSASCLEKTHNESAVHPSAAMLLSTEKEISCPHKGFRDAVAPLNSSSANSRYHYELKTHNESAMDPLTVISTSVGKDLPSLRHGLTSAIALNSSSANSANCSDKTHNESHAHPSNEEIDPEADAEKLSLRRNTGSSLKRARVPELHNKSEKRRRDKINEKMRALQQLIPNSGKTDKSSILDEAIEYLKYLQFQIQYMWMQSGMDPRPLMLFTGMQPPKAYHQPPYLQQMGMSTGLMGMDMAMGFGTSIGHPSNHMATMQAIPGQRIPSSQQLHPNSSFFNATNGYDSMQSSAVNATYGTHFPHSEHHQQ